MKITRQSRPEKTEQLLKMKNVTEIRNTVSGLKQVGDLRAQHRRFSTRWATRCVLVVESTPFPLKPVASGDVPILPSPHAVHLRVVAFL